MALSLKELSHEDGSEAPMLVRMSVEGLLELLSGGVHAASAPVSLGQFLDTSIMGT